MPINLFIGSFIGSITRKVSVPVILGLNKCWSTDFYGRRNCTIRSSSRSHNSWFVDLSYIMIRLGGSPELLASSRRNLWSRKQPATSWLSRPKCGFQRPPSREHYDRTSFAREWGDKIYFLKGFYRDTYQQNTFFRVPSKWKIILLRSSREMRYLFHLYAIY